MSTVVLKLRFLFLV